MNLYRVHGFGCGNLAHDAEGFATKPSCAEWCGDQDKCVVALRKISDIPAAPPVERAELAEQETGFLIEQQIDGQPQWFVGDSDYKFTKDASQALRFARARDALLFFLQWVNVRGSKAMKERWMLKPPLITEHIFYSDNAALRRPQSQVAEQGHGIYVASRASVPERSSMWRELRSAGHPIISTWIDEAGAGETESFAELWARITSEIARCERLILYAAYNDYPLKGALIEVGMALALGKPVCVVNDGANLTEDYKPLGSWAHHPLVTIVTTVADALLLTALTPPQPQAQDARAELSDEEISKIAIDSNYPADVVRNVLASIKFLAASRAKSGGV